MTIILITRWEMGKVKRWLLLSTSSPGCSRAPGARRRRRFDRQIHKLHFSDDASLFVQPSGVGSLVVGDLCPSHRVDLLLGRLVPRSRRSWSTRTTRRKPKWGRRLSPASSRSAFRSASTLSMWRLSKITVLWLQKQSKYQAGGGGSPGSSPLRASRGKTKAVITSPSQVVPSYTKIPNIMYSNMNKSNNKQLNTVLLFAGPEQTKKDDNSHNVKLTD